MRSPQPLMHAMPTPCSAMRVTAPCWLERLEPSPDDGMDAAWRDARERRRHARDQGRVEAGTRADRLVVNGAPQADVTRRRGHNRDQQGFPLTERWEGSRDWKPAMPRGSYRPDRLIIDRPGQCEVRCEQSGREYRCRTYRCEGSRPMDFADIEQRWQQHVNEFFAEQGMPEEFFYEARGDGEEPQLVLDTEHARVYAAWLATKGHITDVEHQWLARDIQQREEDRRDEVAE